MEVFSNKKEFLCRGQAHPQEANRISTLDLTIKEKTPDGRVDNLWEVHLCLRVEDLQKLFRDGLHFDSLNIHEENRTVENLHFHESTSQWKHSQLAYRGVLARWSYMFHGSISERRDPNWSGCILVLSNSPATVLDFDFSILKVGYPFIYVHEAQALMNGKPKYLYNAMSTKSNYYFLTGRMRSKGWLPWPTKEVVLCEEVRKEKVEPAKVSKKDQQKRLPGWRTVGRERCEAYRVKMAWLGRELTERTALDQVSLDRMTARPENTEGLNEDGNRIRPPVKPGMWDRLSNWHRVNGMGPSLSKLALCGIGGED